jgi:hypothetical protein
MAPANSRATKVSAYDEARAVTALHTAKQVSTPMSSGRRVRPRRAAVRGSRRGRKRPRSRPPATRSVLGRRAGRNGTAQQPGREQLGHRGGERRGGQGQQAPQRQVGGAAGRRGRGVTQIIRKILPFLNEPDQLHLDPECLTPEVAGLLRREAERLQQRIDCLTRNRGAIQAYLATVQPDTAPPSGVEPARCDEWLSPATWSLRRRDAPITWSRDGRGRTRRRTPPPGPGPEAAAWPAGGRRGS